MDDLCVARSVARAETDQQYTMICSFGRTTAKVPAGTLVGHPCGILQQPRGCLKINFVQNAGLLDPAFEKDIFELDVNPDLTKDQQESLRTVIQRQKGAFAYGTRTLSRTDLPIMKIEIGDAHPVFQLSYHASPAGGNIIDETLTELIAKVIIKDSDSPRASPVILVRQKGNEKLTMSQKQIRQLPNRRYSFPVSKEELLHNFRC